MGNVITIVGCTDTSGSGGHDYTPLNTAQVIVSITNNTTFTFATTLANGSVVLGATKTAGFSPVGYTKSFNGAHLAAYQANDTNGKQDYLRVDDSNDTYALVRAYTAMSGISAGTGPYPTVGQAANGFQWLKGYISDGSELSVSSIVVANHIATVTTTADHNLVSRDRVAISAATPSSLNGTKKITVRGPRLFEYVSSETDQTATGTIKAIKGVTHKWYLYGDSKGFHLFIELEQGVYGLCEFGDINSFRTTNKNSIIGGVLGDSYYVCTALGGTTQHYVRGSQKKNVLVPVTDIAYTSKTKTSTISLPALDVTDTLEEASVLVGTTKVGTLRGLYISPYRSGAAYGSGTTSGNTPLGGGSSTPVAFQTIAGSPSFVTNIFVETNGSW